MSNVLVIVLALLLAPPLHAAWQSAVTGHMLGKRMPPLALKTAAAPAAQRTGHAAGADGADGADGANRVILLDFWAPWCAPCQERVPLLNALQAAYREQGLTVIGMAREGPGDSAGTSPGTSAGTSNRASAGASAAAHGADARPRVPFAYTVGADPGGGLFARMGVRSLPYAVLVDRNGIVVWQGDPSRLSRATIEATLRAPRLGTLTRF